eukprot:712679-Prymnesium_polylepis.1
MQADSHLPRAPRRDTPRSWCHPRPMPTSPRRDVPANPAAARRHRVSHSRPTPGAGAGRRGCRAATPKSAPCFQCRRSPRWRSIRRLEAHSRPPSAAAYCNASRASGTRAN